MGAANVGLVYARWALLPHRAFRVLTYMALVSLDNDSPPRYWAGREPLAHALGRTQMDKRATYAVRDAIAQLQRAGVIARVVDPKPGQRAEYELRLWAPPQMVTGNTSPNGDGSAVPMVTAEPSNGDGSAVPMVTAQPCPKEDSRSTGTLQEEGTRPHHVNAAAS